MISRSLRILEARIREVGLGFILALPSVYFVAVWRHGFGWVVSRRALRFHGGVAAILIRLFLLFYGEEGWRGRRSWTVLQREAADWGESLEFDSLETPEVPDHQNFAKAPGVAELLGLNDRRLGGNLNPFYHGSEDRWPSASWALQQYTDLAAWQKFFRSHAEKAIREEHRGYVLNFPATPEAQAPADDVLTALGKFERKLAPLRAAGERPVLRWPLDYEKGWFIRIRRWLTGSTSDMPIPGRLQNSETKHRLKGGPSFEASSPIRC